MSQWAAWLPVESAPATASLRLRPGILVLVEENGIWLRGDSLTDDLELQLRKLPGARRFVVNEDRSIVPHGARLPQGHLPEGAWQLLATWICPAAQPAALAGRVDARVSLRLQRSTRELAPTIVVTSFSHWRDYALSAPLVRLQGLTFAVAQDGRTIVRGQPVPPIAGVRWIEREGIALLCGFEHVPAIDSATLRALLKIEPTDLALIHDDASWERISAEDFVRATRGSVRATEMRLRGALCHESL